MRDKTVSHATLCVKMAKIRIYIHSASICMKQFCKDAQDSRSGGREDKANRKY